MTPVDRHPAWHPAMPAPTLKGPSPVRGRQKRERLHVRCLHAIQGVLHGALNGSSASLAKAVKVLAVVDLFFFAATIVTASQQTDVVSLSRDLTYAVIGAVSSIFGFAGAKSLDRGVLMMYFVLVLWGVASSTSNINANVTERQKQSDICAHFLTSEEQSNLSGASACTAQLVILTIKLLAISINLLLQLFSAWLALRLSEKIQEEQEGEEKAKEASTAMEISFRRQSMAVASKRKGSISVGSLMGSMGSMQLGGSGKPPGPLAAMMAGNKGG